MFFKQLRTLSLQKNIALVLKSRVKDFKSSKVKSIGVIFDHASYHNYDFFRNLTKEFGLSEHKIKFISKINFDEDKPNIYDVFFSLENFDWLGRPKNMEISEFVKQPFDILISYYKHNQLDLNLITSRSKANLKIGLTNDDPRLNDLIINIEPKDTDVFKTELIKYLTQLNRL
tara:strand:+ start:842 stop:1360 length:519 start_codon:yes stop_codon:yes gene_type:complete